MHAGGHSRFITWARKVVLVEVSAKMAALVDIVRCLA
jgi:hypothetical protein